MKGKRELRIFAASLEVRAGTADDTPARIAGYAALFNTWSEDLGGFREQIAPGAFTKTLQESDVRALVNHDPNHVLGRTKPGTLKLWEDKRGLAFEITPPDAQWARDVVASIERGDMDQMSFGFRTIKDHWERGENLAERTLLEVQLFDVSVVTFPAYHATSASLRSVLEGLDSYVPEPPTDAKPAQDGHSARHSEGDSGPTEPEQRLHSAHVQRERELALLERTL